MPTHSDRASGDTKEETVDGLTVPPGVRKIPDPTTGSSTPNGTSMRQQQDVKGKIRSVDGKGLTLDFEIRHALRRDGTGMHASGPHIGELAGNRDATRSPILGVRAKLLLAHRHFRGAVLGRPRLVGHFHPRLDCANDGVLSIAPARSRREPGDPARNVARAPHVCCGIVPCTIGAGRGFIAMTASVARATTRPRTVAIHGRMRVDAAQGGEMRRRIELMGLLFAPMS